MTKIIGIDLGTTNSCVSIMEGNTPHPIKDENGEHIIPSWVSWTQSNKAIVGRAAKRSAITSPERTIYSSKRLIGRRENDKSAIKFAKSLAYNPIYDEKAGWAANINGDQIGMVQIASTILAELKRVAEAYCGEPISQAVITVPAHFNDQQRQSTKQAGEIAGLKIRRILSEPTAAAIAHGFSEGGERQNIAVYDLGGGTFDITFIEIGGGTYRVLATGGDTALGGEDFDNEIIAWIKAKFRKTHDMDIGNDPASLSRLKEAAEKAKIDLSYDHRTTISIPFISNKNGSPVHIDMVLERDEFEDMVSHLFDKTAKPCIETLKQSGLSADQIDHVILAGGGSKIPQIASVVHSIFDKRPTHSKNPDEVVAAGAAIYGALIGGDIRNMIMLDVTPLSVGIETQGGLFTKTIERNTTIPTSYSSIFTTSYDYQDEVTINLFQGERDFVKDNIFLGSFLLKGFKKAPRGIAKIEIVFDIDVNGIIKVRAHELSSDVSQEVTVETSKSLTEQNIAEIIAKASEQRAGDQERRKEVEQRHQASAAFALVDKVLADFADKIEQPQRKDIVEQCEKIDRLISQNNIGPVDIEIRNLNRQLMQLDLSA